MANWQLVENVPSKCPPGAGSTQLVLIGDIFYIWGGYPYSDVLYAFDVDTHGWFIPRVSGTVPGVRQGHSACVAS